MNSENQTNTLFRPLKKASTVAFVAFALFASAAHADLGTPLGAEKSKAAAQEIFNKIDNNDKSIKAPEFVGQKKGLITLVVANNGTSCSADVTRVTGTNANERPKHTVQTAECFFNTEADLAK